MCWLEPAAWEEPAFQIDSPWLVLLQKRSEVLQQAIEGVKDSVWPLVVFILAHGCCLLFRLTATVER